MTNLQSIKCKRVGFRLAAYVQFRTIHIWVVGSRVVVSQWLVRLVGTTAIFFWMPVGSDRWYSYII